MGTATFGRWVALGSLVILTACSGAEVATAVPAVPTLDAGPTQTIGALAAQLSAAQATANAPTSTPAFTATPVATATPPPPTATPASAATATVTRTPAPPTATRTIAPTAAPTQATGAKVGDTAQGQGYAVTVHEMVDPAPPGSFLEPKAGNRWVAFDVTVQDTGSAPLAFNEFYFKLKGVDNREYNLAFGGTEPSFNSGTHQPGEATRGWVTFEVPKDLVLATLTYDPTFGKSRVVFDLR